MRAPHTNLPDPANGMNLARRPTGITIAIIVALLTMTAAGIVPTIWSSLNGSLFTAARGGFDGIDGLIGLFSFGFAVLLLWLWVAKKEKRSFRTLGFSTDRATSLRLALRGFGIGVAMMAICVAVPVLTGQAQLGWASPGATSLLVIVGMLFGFFVQGSTEEILSRGFLTQAVARRWGLVAGVIVQAVFFTAMHGFNPGMGALPVINLMLFAFFASLMSLAEGSLWGVCALHGAWNWAQGNLFGVAVSGQSVSDSVFTYSSREGSIDLITGGAFGAEGSLVTTVVYLLGAYIAWRAFQKRRSSVAVGESVSAG